MSTDAKPFNCREWLTFYGEWLASQEPPSTLGNTNHESVQHLLNHEAKVTLREDGSRIIDVVVMHPEQCGCDLEPKKEESHHNDG